jgi:hypothetical protein
MEKMNFRSRFALLLTILIAPLAGVSAAGLIDIDNVNSANANAAVNAKTVIDDTKADVNANANIRANANTDIKTNSGSGSTTSNGSATVETGRNGGVDVEAGRSGNTISIDRSSDEVKANGGVSVTVDRVMTDADLKGFAATEVRNDSNLNGIKIADDKIEVHYKQPARFLGIIPMMVSVGVNVYSDGSVNVDYPWYSFLALTNKADLEASIESEVKAFLEDNGNVALNSRNSISANASTTASTTAQVSSTTPSANADSMTGITVLTPSAKASLIARIHALLKSHLTNGSGNASTTQADVNI